jgi:heme exporter protein A
MLQARDLTCVRGERMLFSALSFSLEPGQAVRVAGANGTGKTSLLRMLCGLTLPAGGEVLWQGLSIRKQREEYHSRMCYIGHASAVKDDLTAVENLTLSAALGGLKIGEAEAWNALQRIGLEGQDDLPARALSQGQRRRAVLARLLIAPAPALWILDEPFTALDRQAVQQLCEVLAGHLDAGGMLVLTTHQEAPIAGHTARVVSLDGRC